MEYTKPEFDLVHTIKVGPVLIAEITCQRGSRPRRFSVRKGAQGRDGNFRMNEPIFIFGQGEVEIDYTRVGSPSEEAELKRQVLDWCLAQRQADEDKFIASKARKEEKSKPRSTDGQKKKYDGPRRKGDSKGRGQSHPQDFEG